MPIVFQREKVNYLTKQDVNIVNKNGGAIYTPNIYKRGGAIYKMGTKYRDGESIGSIFSSAGNWIANNASTIGSATNALGSVAGAISNIVKSGVEIDNMKKKNEAEIQAIKDRAKAEVSEIFRKKKTKEEPVTNTNANDFQNDNKDGGKYTANDLKTNKKTKDNLQTDLVVNKILGRTKKDLVNGNGFKYVLE